MTPRPSDHPKRITVFLSDQQHEDLIKSAKKKGLTASALMRLLVLEYLDKESKQ